MPLSLVASPAAPSSLLSRFHLPSFCGPASNEVHNGAWHLKMQRVCWLMWLPRVAAGHVLATFLIAWPGARCSEADLDAFDNLHGKAGGCLS